MTDRTHGDWLSREALDWAWHLRQLDGPPGDWPPPDARPVAMGFTDVRPIRTVARSVQLLQAQRPQQALPPPGRDPEDEQYEPTWVKVISV